MFASRSTRKQICWQMASPGLPAAKILPWWLQRPLAPVNGDRALSAHLSKTQYVSLRMAAAVRECCCHRRLLNPWNCIYCTMHIYASFTASATVFTCIQGCFSLYMYADVSLRMAAVRDCYSHGRFRSVRSGLPRLWSDGPLFGAVEVSCGLTSYLS